MNFIIQGTETSNYANGLSCQYFPESLLLNSSLNAKILIWIVSPLCLILNCTERVPCIPWICSLIFKIARQSSLRGPKEQTLHINIHHPLLVIVSWWVLQLIFHAISIFLAGSWLSKKLQRVSLCTSLSQICILPLSLLSSQNNAYLCEQKLLLRNKHSIPDSSISMELLMLKEIYDNDIPLWKKSSEKIWISWNNGSTYLCDNSGVQ